MSKFNDHVKSDKAKWIITGIVLVLILAILAGVVAAVVTETNPKEWFEEIADDVEKIEDVVTDGSGAVVGEITNNGIALAASEAVIASDGTLTQTLTATVYPSTTTDKSVNWSVAFKNPSSSWASGKTVTDYVTVTPEASTTTATVSCKAAFGEQVIVTAIARSNENVSATCTFDYVKRVSSISCNLRETDMPEGTSGSVIGTYTSSTDTIFIDADFGSSLADEIKNASYIVFDTSCVYGIGTIEEDVTISVDYELNAAVQTRMYPHAQGAYPDTTFTEIHAEYYIKPYVSGFITPHYEGDMAPGLSMEGASYLMANWGNIVNDLIDVCRGIDVWTVTVTVAGEKNSYSHSFGVQFDEASLQIVAESMTMSDTSIAF